MMERNRVREILAGTKDLEGLTVKDFAKFYGSYRAVNHICLQVDK
jgi:hypothetical protein